MTATFTDSEIADYVAEVAAHLGALPEGERAELLDDLREHLAEVAAEADGPLQTRLGLPADYAAELLVSAGLAPPPRVTGWASVVASWQRSVRVGRTYRSTAAFLAELRPGWWVLRGVLAVFAGTVLLINDWERTWPVPHPGPINRVVLVLPVLAAVAVSVRVGRRLAAGRSNLVTVANVLVVVATVLAADAMHDHRAGVRSVIVEPAPGLIATDGVPLTNIFPYDADGQLLHGVLLYDQRGRPLDLQDQAARAGMQTGVPVDANGGPVTNAYPLEQRQLGYVDPAPGPEAGQPPAVVVPRQATSTTSAPPTTGAPFSGAG